MPAEGKARLSALDVPGPWEDAVRAILRDEVASVLVLGGPDAGKSTFCTVLLAAAVAEGRPAALLDADVGQPIAGPPACASLVRWPPGPEARPDALAFAGGPDPVRGWGRLVEGVEALARPAGPGVVVVNTGGLLAGPGRELKAAKIAAARPALLVALGDDPGLGPVLADHAGLPALRLPVSPGAVRRSRARRQADRREAFRRYFAGARGRPWRREAGGTPPGEWPEVGRLVALRDASGRDRALGLIGGTWAAPTVVTPWAPEPGTVLVRGDVVLNAACDETHAA